MKKNKYLLKTKIQLTIVAHINTFIQLVETIILLVWKCVDIIKVMKFTQVKKRYLMQLN